MIRGCKRCRPADVPGELEVRHVFLDARTTLIENVSLCAPCREQARIESQAGFRRSCGGSQNFTALYELWYLPTVEEPE